MINDYKELTIPPTVEGEYAISPNYAHVCLKQDFLMLGLSNQDKNFTIIFFMSFKGFDSLKLESDVFTFSRTHFP